MPSSDPGQRHTRTAALELHASQHGKLQTGPARAGFVVAAGEVQPSSEDDLPDTVLDRVVFLLLQAESNADAPQAGRVELQRQRAERENGSERGEP